MEDCQLKTTGWVVFHPCRWVLTWRMYLSIKIHTHYSSMIFECQQVCDYGHRTLSAKASDWTSQETTAKRKRERKRCIKIKKNITYPGRPSETTEDTLVSTTTATGSGSLLAAILVSHSSLRYLLSARTEHRTTGLMTAEVKDAPDGHISPPYLTHSISEQWPPS